MWWQVGHSFEVRRAVFMQARQKVCWHGKVLGLVRAISQREQISGSLDIFDRDPVKTTLGFIQITP
jgi:hypothetical protein